MVYFNLGRKIGMTQIFDDRGLTIPVTIIKAGPCIIVQIKNDAKHGYSSVQIGYDKVEYNKVKKPILGHFKKNNITPLKYLFEMKIDSLTKCDIGQLIKVDSFVIGQKVKISANSIGKGFSGCQKRHNFARGPMSHGSKNHRQPGSIGAGTTPGRVIPGKKMAGQLGNKKTTIKNLKIVYIDKINNLLGIKGSVPGKTGNLLKVVSV
uniref:Large ribosomal subunit protein uL3c n=1 Tax=Boldia erythrosiphon TaxID=74908 RepID=A0A1Y9TLR5_9RHOD|nr:50S ribosomal protein L3 [Boldia erythrosiphon]ARO90581.1 50S ribosomal protein L3 [Boldia erythrosiphon]